MNCLIAPTLGSKIRKIRLVQGLTLHHLAELSDLSPTELDQIESNLCLPEEEVVSRVARALGKAPELLIYHTDYHHRRAFDRFLVKHPDPEVNPRIGEYLEQAWAQAPELSSRLTDLAERRLDLPDPNQALARQACRNWREALFLLHAVAKGGDPIVVRPLELGLPYHVAVDPQEGLLSGFIPHSGLLLSLDRHDLLLLPNLTLRDTRGETPFTLPFLIVGLSGGERFAVGLALNTAAHVAQAACNALGLPLLAFQDEELLSEGLIEGLDERLGTVLQAEIESQICWSLAPVTDRLVEHDLSYFTSKDICLQ